MMHALTKPDPTATTAVTTMRAVVNNRYGDAEHLEVTRVPVPMAPRPGELVVRVEAAALNPADKFLMLGRPALVRLTIGLTRPSPKNRVRGHDLAGLVTAIGDGVAGLQVGDRVFGSTPGALAEYVCGRQEVFAAMPARLTFEEAAVIPMGGLAALHGLRDAAGLEAGQHVLIVGATGGIGTLAIQIAKSMGAEVTAVCSTRNVQLARDLGADHVIDYTQGPATRSERHYDVILDNVANHRIVELRTLLTPTGTLLINSGESGPDGGPIVRILKAAVFSLTGRRKVRSYLSTPNAGDLAVLADMVERGTLTPVIDEVFPLERAAEAMARLATRRVRGKLVVRVAGAG